MSKNVKLILLFVVIVFLIAVIVKNQLRSDPNADKVVSVVCTNVDCKEVYEVSFREFEKMLTESTGETVGLGGIVAGSYGQMPAKCKFCGQKRAYVAEKCENCGCVFVLNYLKMNDYIDRCPECRYSKTEKASK